MNDETAQRTTPKSPSRNLIRAIVWPLLILVVAILGYRAWVNAPPMTTPVIAFITADETPYWDRVIEGAEAASKEYGVDLRVLRPNGDLEAQNTLLTRATRLPVDAIAVSPVNATRQTAKLRQIASSTPLLTMDSDSEYSDRVCFVGMNNYNAGRRCGELVKEAIPEGGRVLIVSGSLDKSNGRQRRMGLIDELMERPLNQGADSPPIDASFESERYEIPPTLVDPIDPEIAKQQVLDRLNAGERYDCIVGLYGYHAPAIVGAIEASGVTDPIMVVGFDAVPETLAAIEAGDVYGVIAQDRFSYGFESVRILAKVSRGADYAVPVERRIEFPPSIVTAGRLEAFRDRALRMVP